ncbi:MAG: hypothetical protein OXI96_08510, partial [Acidimicrobiaceae bacterium]|nr:hypothetical protein [Acidimicrobiaceae bacterium]
MLDRIKNPVVALELSKRYKNRAYVIVVYAVYAVYAVYSVFVLVDAAWKTWRYSLPFFYPDGREFGELLGATIGLTVWPVVVVIFLVVPVLAAVSVVGERRRGTLMPVQLSLLRPFDIVWGKVVASVAPVLCPVVVCVVVLYSFSLFSLVLTLTLNMGEVNVQRLFGSVTVGAGVGAGLVVLSMAVSVVCVSCSTFAKSSAAAIAMPYG